MITKSILYNIFIFISLLIVLTVPVSSESINTDLVWKNNDFIDNIGNRSHYTESGTFYPPQFTGGRGVPEPEPIRLPFESWQLPAVSIGVSLIILIIMLIAGFSIGGQYHYSSSKRAGFMMIICHIISASLIGAFIFVLYGLGSFEGGIDPFIHTMYATFGILFYLALSSVIQAVSLFRNRTLVPLHQAHILFSVIAIILLLSVRIPVNFALQVNIVTALTIITPGAAFSLITTHFIHKKEGIGPGTGHDQTITRSLPLISAELPPSFPERLTSKYHDISVIGSGGMAIVYRAIRNADGKIVALKIPFSADETSGKTFLNEMSVWRDLTHPHIAQITDQNIFPVPYVELEYIPRSLKDITLPVSPGRALIIIRQIASALAYAHENGVIHRDIKPGNVLIADDGTVKLTDWGLSRLIERDDDTRNTSFSLFYASPEQLSPEKYGNGDQRTDIYQLGILLYELICGTPPYGTSNIGELFTRIQKNEYILPSEVNSALKFCDEIVSRSLQADPNLRYQNVKEFIAMINLISESLKKLC